MGFNSSQGVGDKHVMVWTPMELWVGGKRASHQIVTFDVFRGEGGTAMLNPVVFFISGLSGAMAVEVSDSLTLDGI